MASQTIAWDHHRTDRLILSHVGDSDTDDWHRIHADPRLWTHYPTGRHTAREQTAELIQTSVAAWDGAGLGYWTVRDRLDGPVVGCGGCRPVAGQQRWNLYYRFDPSTHGKGYATELARVAVEAANAVAPHWPVTALMLETNPASWRVAEKIGLRRIWTCLLYTSPSPRDS